MTLAPGRRGSTYGYWWIPDESPGGPGSPELWADEAALGFLAAGGEPGITVIADTRGRSGPVPLRWAGARLRFGCPPGEGYRPVTYRVVSRCFGPVNLGRPYYVLKLVDYCGPWGTEEDARRG